MDLAPSPERLKQNVLRFIVVKIFLALLGIVFSASVLASRGDWVLISLAGAGVDLLCLIPFYFFAARNLKTAIQLTRLAVGVTIVNATLILFLAGGFTHPFVLTYFGLLPLALLVVPAPVMIWSSASISTLAYLILVTMQIAGLIPSASDVTAEAWRWLPFAVSIVLGLWVESVLIAIFTVSYETRRQDLDRRVYAESVWSTVGKTVISTQDLDHILTTVIQIINEKMHVETGSILLREPDTDTIRFAKIMRGDIEEFASLRLKVGQGIVGWVVLTGQSGSRAGCVPRLALVQGNR